MCHEGPVLFALTAYLPTMASALISPVPFIHKTKYVQKKFEAWVKEVEQLSKFAETQPHTAFTNYLLRVTDWELLSLSEILKPLES